MGKKHSGLIARLHTGGLARKLSVADLFAVGYGDLGSSIFYALGITTFFALGAAPISMILGGLVFVCTSLTYAEMTAALKAQGGAASFTRFAFNDLVSFIAGWGLLLDFIVTIAISIFSVYPYLSSVFGGYQNVPLHLSVSAVLIGLLFILNYMGAKHSTRVSIVLTTAALATQVLIIGVAIFSGVDFMTAISHLKIGTGASWSPSWSEFWKGTAMAMVAYTGIESIAALGSETKRPIRSLPRAVMIVMFVLVFMYLFMSLVGLSVMSPQELGTTYLHDPLYGIVKNLPWGGSFFAPWIGLLAAALLFVAGNAGLMGASRLSFNMGEYYQLPRFFFRTHRKRKTPYASLAIFGALAIVIILLSRGRLHFLADLYNFGAMIAFFSAHVSLIALRIKKPDMERPFRAPLNIPFGKNIKLPLPAILGALGTLAVWVVVVYTKPEGRTLGFIWMGIGLAMYYLYRRKKKIEPTGQVKVEKVVVPDYEPMDIKRILVPTRGGAETDTVQLACELAKIHRAEVTAIHLLTVPYSMPLTSPLPYRKTIGEAVLQRAEAIAHEFHIEIKTELLPARDVEEAILQQLSEKKYDLLVIGSRKSRRDPHAGLGIVTERILKRAPCRVFVTGSII